MQNEDMEEIDLVELGHVLLKKWYLIFLSGILCAVAGFGVTKYAITPQYQASSMIYILSKSTSVTSVMDLQIGKQLTVDFATLSKSRPVLNKVIDELNLDTTYESLLETISVENPEQTQILKISVTNPDPKLACKIANAMANSTADRVAEVMVTDRPSMAEEAVVPKRPIAPNTKKNTAIAGLIGMFLISAVVIMRYLLDDTLKNEDDVEKYIGVATLASIPITDKKAANKRKNRK